MSAIRFAEITPHSAVWCWFLDVYQDGCSASWGCRIGECCNGACPVLVKVISRYPGTPRSYIQNIHTTHTTGLAALAVAAAHSQTRTHPSHPPTKQRLVYSPARLLLQAASPHLPIALYRLSSPRCVRAQTRFCWVPSTFHDVDIHNCGQWPVVAIPACLRS